MSQDTLHLQDFHGQARLFPLPNLVLFPHVVQPLHVFEPRYRQLLADALEDDRLIAMALLCPGWEQDYHKKPPIHPVVCLGRVQQEQRLADGRYNLLLQGLCRARIQKEVEVDRLYRIASVEILQEARSSAAREAELREQLVERVTPFFAGHESASDQVERLLRSELPLGALCDIFAFALPLAVEVKQLLLEQPQVEPRVQLLLCSLEGRQPPAPPPSTKRTFPPSFSAN